MRSLAFYLSLIIAVKPFTSSQTLPTNEGSVSGEVRDAVTKQPLPGANVIVAGTSLGTSCNAEGYYVIKNLPPGKHVLKATMLGY